MQLKEFIEQFVAKNTLVRLWYKELGGHSLIDSSKLYMEWELVESDFALNEVEYITDILVPGPYVEAVNIVIKRR